MALGNCAQRCYCSSKYNLISMIIATFSHPTFCRQQNPKNSILMTLEAKEHPLGLNGVIFYCKHFFKKYSSFVTTRENRRP
jgi:hypothetical protein